ncbi:MAG: hypothetical protein IPG85_09770 [Bacteroidetes bacterium]|nr:hypothetical protein [Bacteroidota bacterium]
MLVMGAASNVNRAFEGMNRRVHATGRSISDINTRLAELRRSHEISVDTRQIANARRQIDALERQRNRLSNLGSGSSSTGLGLGGLVKGFVGYQALSMAGSGIASALRTGSQMQTSQTGLKTFLGDKGAASAFSNIQKMRQQLLMIPKLYFRLIVH